MAERSVRLGAWLFRRRGWLPVPLVALVLAFRPTLWAGLGVVALGEGIRLLAVGHIGGASRTRGADVGPLVASGPYAWVRNPLYLGNILLWAGVSTVAWPAALVVIPAIVAYYTLIVRWEEHNLGATLGEAYRAYCQRVPRWVPRAPTVPSRGGWSLGKALRTERSTLLALAIVLAAVTIRGLVAG